MKIDKIEIEGIAELDAALAELGREVATKLGHKAFKASADHLKQVWITAAPYQPEPTEQNIRYGHLKHNIKVRKVAPEKETAIVYGVTTGNAYWGRFQEYGTAQQPAKPWARPSMEAAKDELVSIQIRVLREGIERIAKKARRGRSRVSGKA